MSDDTKTDILAALRDRLFELNHQRDLAEMEIGKIDARISEINDTIEMLGPKRRGRSKGAGMRIAVVPENLSATTGLPTEPEDAA